MLISGVYSTGTAGLESHLQPRLSAKGAPISEHQNPDAHTLIQGYEHSAGPQYPPCVASLCLEDETFHPASIMLILQPLVHSHHAIHTHSQQTKSGCPNIPGHPSRGNSVKAD